MSTTERLELLEAKLQHIGMMGQWYQRYDISTGAQECKIIVKELKEKLDEPCGMSRK
jgi:sulfur relay (sulfurtransferase) DsrC/TusE family protein